MDNKKICPRCKGTNIETDYENNEQYCADCGETYNADYEAQLKLKQRRKVCPDCGGTNIISEHHTHERICADCGTILV